MLLFVAGGSLLSLVTELINMGFVVPSAKCEIEITERQQGILLSIGFLGIVASSHIWGFLTDTWGRKKSLQLALISGHFFSVLSAFSTSSVMLIIMRFLTGFWYVFYQMSLALNKFYKYKASPYYIYLVALITWVYTIIVFQEFSHLRWYTWANFTAIVREPKL